MADAAGAAVDQDPLPGLEAAVVEQALPGRQAGERHGGGVNVVDAFGLGDRLAHLQHDIFRRAAAAAAKQGVNAVASVEILRPCAAGLHDAGNVAPERDRQFFSGRRRKRLRKS